MELDQADFWSIFPREVQFKIVLNLPGRDVATVLPLVSKEMRTLSADEYLWKNFCNFQFRLCFSRAYLLVLKKRGLMLGATGVLSQLAAETMLGKQSPIDWKKEFIVMLNNHRRIVSNSFDVRKEDKSLVKLLGPTSIQYLIESDGGDEDVVAIQANMPLQPFPVGDFTIGYYELTVVSKGEAGKIGIGLALPGYNRAMPGWGIDSYGYHGDDGNLFICRPFGLDFTDPWEDGDVVGVGLNYATAEIFFTRNGLFLGVAAQRVRFRRGLFPTIGMHSKNESVKVNFGGEPFMFDLAAWLRRERSRDEADAEAPLTATKPGDDDIFDDEQDEDVNVSPQEPPYGQILYSQLVDELTPDRILAAARDEPNDEIHDMGASRYYDLGTCPDNYFDEEEQEEQEQIDVQTKAGRERIIKQLRRLMEFFFMSFDYLRDPIVIKELDADPNAERGNAKRLVAQLEELIALIPDLPPAALTGTFAERRPAICAHVTDMMCTHYAELFHLTGYLFRINEEENPEFAKKQRENDQAKRWLSLLLDRNWPSTHPLMMMHLNCVRSILKIQDAPEDLEDPDAQRFNYMLILAYRLLAGEKLLYTLFLRSKRVELLRAKLTGGDFSPVVESASAVRLWSASLEDVLPVKQLQHPTTLIEALHRIQPLAILGSEDFDDDSEEVLRTVWFHFMGEAIAIPDPSLSISEHRQLFVNQLDAVLPTPMLEHLRQQLSTGGITNGEAIRAAPVLIEYIDQILARRQGRRSRFGWSLPWLAFGGSIVAGAAIAAGIYFLLPKESKK